MAKRTDITPSDGAIALTISPPSLQGFEARIVQLNAIAAEVEIGGDADFASAVELARMLRQVFDALETERTSVTGPMNEAKRRVDAWYAGPKARASLARAIVDGKIGRYQLDKAHREREAYALAAKAANVGNVDAMADAMNVAIETRPAEITGGSVRYAWSFEVIAPDLLIGGGVQCMACGAKLPAYTKLVPDTDAIAAMLKRTAPTAQPEPIPGVRFTLRPVLSLSHH